MEKETAYKHELVVPNEDLPFKLFVFEGKEGNYVRDRHWHRSIEIFDEILNSRLTLFSSRVSIYFR